MHQTVVLFSLDRTTMSAKKPVAGQQGRTMARFFCSVCAASNLQPHACIYDLTDLIAACENCMMLLSSARKGSQDSIPMRCMLCMWILVGGCSNERQGSCRGALLPLAALPVLLRSRLRLLHLHAMEILNSPPF